MRYLVLGANGFIGQNLVKKLLKSDVELIAFDRMFNSFNSERFTKIKGEYSIDTDFDELLKGVDIVFHLISTTIPNSDKPYDLEIEENVFPTLKLLDACVKNKVKKIVFISSGGTVYGESELIPFKEDINTVPICSYGIQKLIIEKYLHLYYHKYGLDYSVIRLANPYGPGQNPNGSVGAVTVFLNKAINNQVIHIYGDGNNIRDYIYIDDVVTGIKNISEKNLKYKVINLGSGIGTSLNEIIKFLKINVNKDLQIKYYPKRINDVEYSVLDTSLYTKLFPEHTFISLEEGIKRMGIYLKKGVD